MTEVDRRRVIRARAVWLLLACMLLAAVGAVLLRPTSVPSAAIDRFDSAAPMPAPATILISPPPATVEPQSIAVLPFANLSPDPEDAFFADGLAEELLNVLARIPGLKVTSRSSSFAFRDNRLGAREIAAKLAVAHLVEGSVRRQADQLRITVQLIDARNDAHLWSQTYDRHLTDIFRTEQDIAQAIANVLADSLGVRTVAVPAATSDLQAYAWYLRGRELFASRGANLPAARDLLERAVARDASFADAWATLAGTLYVWRSYAVEPPGVDTRKRAAEAAARALELDARQPLALAVSARLAANAGNRLRAAQWVDQALELEPSNANTWLWKGIGLFEAGHLQEARASFLQAQRLDPLSGLNVGWLGINAALQGDLLTARSWLRQAHTLGWRGPASRNLFLIEEHMDADAAQRYLDWLRDDDGMPPTQRELARQLAPALTDASQRARAQQQLLAAASAEPTLEWATLLQIFGLTDAAVDMALRASAASTQPLLFCMWFPQFRDFREHPRFPEFAEQQGLIAYWRVQGPPDDCRLYETPTPHLECSR